MVAVTAAKAGKPLPDGSVPFVEEYAAKFAPTTGQWWMAMASLCLTSCCNRRPWQAVRISDMLPTPQTSRQCRQNLTLKQLAEAK
jgi:hypothetical protein